MTNKDIIFGTGIASSTVLGFVALLKVSKLCKRLGGSLDDIESRTTFEISDKLIDSVVSDMAERKLDRVIPGKVQETVDGIKAEAILKIRKEVTDKVEALKPEIEEKLRGQVEGVTIDSAHREVIEKAAKNAKEEYLGDIRREKEALIKDLNSYQSDMKDDIQDRVDDVLDELEEKAKDKFETELETLTTRYKSRLDDVSDIYASLASKIVK